MLNKRRLWVFSLIMALTLLLPACASAGSEGAIEGETGAEAASAASEAADETGDQELRVASSFFSGSSNNLGDLAALDPARRGVWGFHSLIWAPLVWGDTAGTPNLDKSLAESWEISEDGTIYTFHLRDDARFSDGSPITAEHIALSFGYWGMLLHKESVAVRDNGARAKRLFPDVVGMLDFPNNVPYDEFGTGEVGDIAGIEVIDDQTLQITLEAPSVTFIKRITVGFAPFHPEDLYAGRDAGYAPLDYWSAHARATGPYKVVDSSPGEYYLLEPNEHYFGPKPSIPRIRVLSVSSDFNTILTAFASGELDIVSAPVVGDFAKQAFADTTLAGALVQVPDWRVQQFWITPNVPLDDVHVRRAIVMALDREVLVKILNAGNEQPLFGPVNMHRNPNVPHCEEETAAVTPLPFDPEMARTELEQSAYWPEVVDMEIHFYANNAVELPQMEAAKLMLEENLGLTNVTIHTEKVSDRNNPPFPVHFWNNTQQPWFPDLTDTLRNMPVKNMKDAEFGPDDPRRFTSVPFVPELRDLANAATAENDPELRCDLVQQIGQVWNDSAFSIDYSVPIGYFLVSKRVQGEMAWYQNVGQGKPLNVEMWTLAGE